MGGTRRVWITVQAVLLMATLVWVARALAEQWDSVRAVAAATQVQWGWVLFASLIVLATYAMLIQSWRLLLSGWGGHLRYGSAVRIWTIANLGRYLPGKLWSVGALGVLAKREGVSGVTAAGAAILGTLLNLGAGFGILALSGTRALGAFSPWLQIISLAISAAFVLGTLLLPRLLPSVLARVAAWRGLPPLETHLPAGTLWIATGINAASWVCYGVAFAAFARGVAPQVLATPSLFIVVWTASYLMGYVVLFAPGGIGVRDAAMTGGLIALGLASSPDATWIALTSRVWLTVWEILPGLLALLLAPRWARSEIGRAD
ncbi:MAG: flippase-like domain-containing protein [Gemmatimonadaceae bacterium]|nr:flippase-like domain-containing protein [Gemmatimonadaceae bacterium]